jgi:hypothetical protein
MASGTEFMIQLQQRITGASITTELARLEDSFKSAAKKYTDLEAEGVKLSKSLDKVGASIVSTAEKMAQAAASGDEKAYFKAAVALQTFQKEQAKLNKDLGANKGALGSQAKEVEKLGEKLIGAKTAQSKLDAVSRAGASAKKLGGPIGKVGDIVNDTIESFEGLTGAIGETGAVAVIGAAGFIAIGAAVGLVGVVAGIALLAFAAWAVKLADTRRETELTIDAMSKTENAASGLSQAFDDVGHDTGVANGRLVDITRQLKQAHVAGKDIPSALRAVATAESALGDSSGTQELIDRLKNGQTTADKLADEMDHRLGGVVQKRMLGLSAQAATFQRNIGNLFGSLNIEPVLEGLAKLVALFDDSTESGRAIRTVFESMFQPLIDNSGPIFTAVERGFLYLVLGALEFAILVKRAGKSIDSFLESIGATTAAFTSFVDMGDLGTAVLVVLAIGFGLLALAAIGIAAPFIAAGVILVGLIAIFVGVVYAIERVSSTVTSIDWANIGHSIVDGILGPIRDPSAVTKAFEDFATNGRDALKNKLGIHSPSTAFEDDGEDSAAGYTKGVKAGTADAHEALERLGGASPKGTPVGGSSLAVHQTNHYDGVKDASDASDRSIADLTDALEGASLQMGAG